MVPIILVTIQGYGSVKNLTEFSPSRLEWVGRYRKRGLLCAKLCPQHFTHKVLFHPHNLQMSVRIVSTASSKEPEAQRVAISCTIYPTASQFRDPLPRFFPLYHVEFLWKLNDLPSVPVMFNPAQFSSNLQEMGCLAVWNSLMVNKEGSKISPGLYSVLALLPWTNGLLKSPFSYHKNKQNDSPYLIE